LERALAVIAVKDNFPRKDRLFSFARLVLVRPFGKNINNRCSAVSALLP